MIIRTKRRIYRPHVKLIVGFLIVAVCSYGLGFAHGYTNGWVGCVDLGLKFVKIGNVIDEELVRQAVLKYKESAGEILFNPQAPFYVGG